MTLWFLVCIMLFFDWWILTCGQWLECYDGEFLDCEIWITQFGSFYSLLVSKKLLDCDRLNIFIWHVRKCDTLFVLIDQNVSDYCISREYWPNMAFRVVDETVRQNWGSKCHRNSKVSAGSGNTQSLVSPTLPFSSFIFLLNVSVLILVWLY